MSFRFIFLSLRLFYSCFFLGRVLLIAFVLAWVYQQFRIGNSVFPDHCGDDDPKCNKFSFYSAWCLRHSVEAMQQVNVNAMQQANARFSTLRIIHRLPWWRDLFSTNSASTKLAKSLTHRYGCSVHLLLLRNLLWHKWLQLLSPQSLQKFVAFEAKNVTHFSCFPTMNVSRSCHWFANAFLCPNCFSFGQPTV